MPDSNDQHAGDSREPGNDPLEVLWTRAREAEVRRDASIAELRQVMDDAEVLDEFGIDLSRLED